MIRPYMRLYFDMVLIVDTALLWSFWFKIWKEIGSNFLSFLGKNGISYEGSSNNVHFVCSGNGDKILIYIII
jgi:hypothetical protein